MPSLLPASEIVRLHGALLDHLSDLDRLGEHVAAAHLAAAIDAIEERFAEPRLQVMRDRRDDPFDAMATGLMTRLGARAATVARRQMDGASGQTLLVWAAIASRIDQLGPPPSADMA